MIRLNFVSKSNNKAKKRYRKKKKTDDGDILLFYVCVSLLLLLFEVLVSYIHNKTTEKVYELTFTHSVVTYIFTNEQQQKKNTEDKSYNKHNFLLSFMWMEFNNEENASYVYL